jgi:hypothetical protein
MKTVYKAMFWVSVAMSCFWMIKGNASKMMVYSAFIWIAKLGRELEEMKEIQSGSVKIQRQFWEILKYFFEK